VVLLRLSFGPKIGLASTALVQFMVVTYAPGGHPTHHHATGQGNSLGQMAEPRRYSTAGSLQRSAEQC